MKDQIIALLLYFDVFEYPLREKEIYKYLHLSPEERDIASECLQNLVKEGLINQNDNYFYTGSGVSKVSRRKEANELARKRMKTATRFSKIISWFPFVRGVYLSGSLSKGAMKKDDDIDYFIVTEPGRLWIARTLLTLFKKVFLFNSYRNFCINYFTDTENLKVEEHNRYTATEIVFLMPVYNYAIYQKMLAENPWVNNYYQGFTMDQYLCREGEPYLKKLLERLLNVFGDRLENYLFVKSERMIHGKFAQKGEEYIKNSFSIKRNELKYFPQQQKYSILERFQSRALKWQQEGKAFVGLSPGNIYSL